VRQVVDVVVLRDDVAVAGFVGAVDGTVDLEDHRALLECEPLVVGVPRDRPARAVGGHVHEAARLVRLGRVVDEVERLAGGG
jgi:hypothetical protein